MKNSPELIRLRSLTNDELLDFYWEQRLSHAQIAEKFDTNRAVVQRLLQKRGITARTNAESQSAINEWRSPNLTSQQEQLIYGSNIS